MWSWWCRPRESEPIRPSSGSPWSAEYVSAKSRLFSAQSSEAVAILNAVNAPCRKIAKNVRSQIFWFDHGHCMGDNSACVKEGNLTVRWRGREHILCPANELQIKG